MSSWGGRWGGTVVWNNLERDWTFLITSINNRGFTVKANVFPVSRTPFVTALQLIETLEWEWGECFGGLCGLGWRVACTAAPERHGKLKLSSVGLAGPRRQQASFPPSQGEPDVTLHSAFALFIVSRQPPRKCPLRDEVPALLCIILEGWSSESIRHLLSGAHMNHWIVLREADSGTAGAKKWKQTEAETEAEDPGLILFSQKRPQNHAVNALFSYHTEPVLKIWWKCKSFKLIFSGLSYNM